MCSLSGHRGLQQGEKQQQTLGQKFLTLDLSKLLLMAHRADRNQQNAQHQAF